MNDAHVGPLAAIDLNLVVVFEALAREKSVTRAAERLGVTQSAMSHALRRLRGVVGDALLVRGRSGMTLTPRAEALVVPFRSGLVAIGRALEQKASFDPRTTRRAFRLVAPDLFDVMCIPPLLARLRAEAPNVDLALLPADAHRVADCLETGEIDVAIAPRVDARKPSLADFAAPGLVRRTLLRDSFICLLRSGHPSIPSKRKRLSLQAYAALPHALVSPSGEGGGPVDRVLAEHGLSRRIALRIPNFYSAIAIVAKSDLVLTGPGVLARVAPRSLRVVTLPPPLRLSEHSLDMVWHERFADDPAHAWVRALIFDVVRDILSPVP